MSEEDGTQGEIRDAGDFSAWLSEMRAALRGDRTAQVPCGSCTACCTSFQFVHVGPDETDTLAHIPSDLLVPAPGKPRGHVVLGYDKSGHCPMLIDGRCSIYDHRPQTCRSYDCRVFAAAGVVADQPAIAERVQQWRFTYREPGDRFLHEAVRFLVQRYGPDAGPIEKAVRAVEGVDS
ncbi:MAG: YkgJ family cysteine cluster protein [Acidimicrobiales bacterium]|nr:YkgJ family cysteine cluster protein [Acidimicrobiales bacterium]